MAETTILCWCKNPECGKELDQNHIGACPHCGESAGKYIHVIATGTYEKKKYQAKAKMDDMDNVTTYEGKKERYVGRCIYCGSTENLSKEHIVPYGLNGELLLLKASCQSCQEITSVFEGHVLRQQFLLARSVLKLPTYNPENRPTEFTFEGEKDGQKVTITLPVDECPSFFMMLHLKKPAYIADYDYEKGTNVIGTSLHVRNPELIREKLGIDTLSFTTTFEGTSFERMLAKIAYGMVVLQYGPDVLEECYVLPCILEEGQKNDVGKWVGSGRDIDELPRNREPYIITIRQKENGEVYVFIRLFAGFNTPEYLVIVGRLKHQ